MGRLTEADVLALLEGRGVAYELYRHEAVWTAGDAVPASIARPDALAKSLFVQNSHGRERFLVVVPLMARVDLRGLARHLGCGHLGLVPAEQMEALIGVGPGSVSPLALLNDPGAATCLIDASFAGGRICVHPLHNEVTVCLACDDLIGLLAASDVDVRTEPILHKASMAHCARSVCAR